MSEIGTRKDTIQKWLEDDGWKPNKERTNQVETLYNLKNNKFQLFLDGNVDKITLLYKYTLSSELQGLGESLILDFVYELRTDLLLLDIYLKYDSNSKTFELQNFIFWEESIRNKLLHSVYKMDQVIDLCEIKDNRFVYNYQTSSME